MTGASGIVYGLRLLDLLLATGGEIHVVVSPACLSVVRSELEVGLPETTSTEFLDVCRRKIANEYFPKNTATKNTTGKIVFHDADDFGAPIASGSFPVDGMIVAPCSCGTLGCIASGVHRHLIHRAADVQLKERRRLVVLVRESPLSFIHLQNMERITLAGGIVQPAIPHFYAAKGKPLTPGDMIDTVTSRSLDLLNVPHSLKHRWRHAD